MKTAQRKSFAHRAGLVLLVLGMLAQAVVPALAAPETFPTLGNAVISNVNEGGFTVSWTSDIVSDGAMVVQDPPNPASHAGAFPDLDAFLVPVMTTSHSVSQYWGPDPLVPSVTVMARSCDALVPADCTDSPVQSVTFGAALGGQDNNPNIGGVVTTSGVGNPPVPFAIVYLTFSLDGTCGGADDSALASARADELGNWQYNLAEARIAALSAYYFDLGGTTPPPVAGYVCLEADGGALGVSQPPPVLLPTQTDGFSTLDPLVLSAPTAVTLSGLTATAGGSTLPAALSAAGILGAAIGIMAVQLRKLSD